MYFTRRDDVCQCFFFQAEDGIRYYKVTGVQTCALPISVEVGVVVVAARVRLEADPEGLPRRAERLEGRRVRRLSEKGPVEAEPALEDGLRSAEPAARERRRHEARVRGPARVEALNPRPVFQELEEARGQAARDAEGGGEPCLVEAVELARGEGRGEGAAGRGRVPTAGVELAWRRHAEPRDGFEPRDDGRDRGAAAGARRLADRQHRGQDDRRGVRDRGGVRIVEVEAVGERAVDERRERRRRGALGAHDGAGAALAAPPLERSVERRRELGRGRGERDPEDVEGAQTHTPDDRGGNVLEPQARGAGGEPARERHGANDTLAPCGGLSRWPPWRSSAPRALPAPTAPPAAGGRCASPTSSPSRSASPSSSSASSSRRTSTPRNGRRRSPTTRAPCSTG